MCMELFDSLKIAFKDSEEKIFLCDSSMEVIWKNKDTLPDVINKDRIRLYYDREFSLPIEKSETCEYKGKFGESCALKIEPLRLEDEIVGYLLHLYSCDDIERISARSGYLKFRSNFLGNIRIEMSRIINMLDLRKQSHLYDKDLDYIRFDRNVRYTIQRAFSATSNYTEMSKYYNGFFKTSFLNISDILEDICKAVHSLFDDNDCDFIYDIDPCVYLNMNEDRLKNVIMNLLVNAYMYNDKKKKVCKFSLKADKENIVIEVFDNGVGIDREQINMALIPFGAFKEFGQHEYLGLAVTKLFCDYFGGKIEFETIKDEYSKVMLVFPTPLKNIPHDFKINHVSPIPNPYDTPTCILAKAFNLAKR